MNPQNGSNSLDPKLRETYSRIMGQSTPQGQSISPTTQPAAPISSQATVPTNQSVQTAPAEASTTQTLQQAQQTVQIPQQNNLSDLLTQQFSQAQQTTNPISPNQSTQTQPFQADQAQPSVFQPQPSPNQQPAQPSLGVPQMTQSSLPSMQPGQIPAQPSSSPLTSSLPYVTPQPTAMPTTPAPIPAPSDFSKPLPQDTNPYMPSLQSPTMVQQASVNPMTASPAPIQSVQMPQAFPTQSIQSPSAAAPQPLIIPINQSADTATQGGRSKGKMMAIATGGVLFFAAYSFFWAKFFNVDLPLPF